MYVSSKKGNRHVVPLPLALRSSFTCNHGFASSRSRAVLPLLLCTPFFSWSSFFEGSRENQGCFTKCDILFFPDELMYFATAILTLATPTFVLQVNCQLYYVSNMFELKARWFAVISQQLGSGNIFSFVE